MAAARGLLFVTCRKCHIALQECHLQLTCGVAGHVLGFELRSTGYLVCRVILLNSDSPGIAGCRRISSGPGTQTTSFEKSRNPFDRDFDIPRTDL